MQRHQFQNFNANKIPSRAKWKLRWRSLKNILFLGLVILVVWQLTVVKFVQSKQIDQAITEIDNLQNELKSLQDPNFDSSNSEVSLEEQLFAVIAAVGKQEKEAQISGELNEAYAKLPKLNWPEDFTFDEENQIITREESAGAVLAFDYNEGDTEITVISPRGKKVYKSSQAFLNFVTKLSQQDLLKLYKETEQLKSAGNNVFRELDRDNAANLLADNKITFESNSDNNKVEFFNEDGENIAELSWQLKNGVASYVASYNDQEINFTSGNLSSQLPRFLVKLNGKNELEKLFEETQRNLEAVFESKAFKKALTEQKLKLTKSDEQADGVVYRIASDGGNINIELLLERGTGLLKLLEGESAIGIEEFLEQAEAKKKRLDIPDQINVGSNSADEVILLAGKHGSLTDTMMLAIVDASSERVDLISLPRDLWWGDRKLNSYYSLGGMSTLVSELEKISGYKIDHYALVDMYAFVDVVNILGGVDVTLEEAVIDPSYKTFDDGKWGTLYYEAGDYHLNGTQALRLARSRHYSSDFARAERQQLILQSLHKKALDISPFNIVKLSALAKAVLSKLETDITVEQSIAYFKKYRNFEVNSAAVLSSGNILESSYSQQEAYEDCLQSGSTSCSKGAYILQPRDGNWDLIKWFIRESVKEA